MASPPIEKFWFFFVWFCLPELVHIRLDPTWHLIYVCSEVPHEENMDAEESIGGKKTHRKKQQLCFGDHQTM